MHVGQVLKVPGRVPNTAPIPFGYQPTIPFGLTGQRSRKCAAHQWQTLTSKTIGLCKMPSAACFT
eukprot:363116-Chlamydomonas_euryale.AAC.4